MSRYTCKVCSKSKPKEQMRRYPSGGVSTTCIDCGPPARGRRPGSTGRELVKLDAPPTVECTPPDPVLRIEQGYGLSARIEEGYLQIQQDDGEGRIDTLMLSKSEAILLFAQFREWARQ